MVFGTALALMVVVVVLAYGPDRGTKATPTTTPSSSLDGPRTRALAAYLRAPLSPRDTFFRGNPAYFTAMPDKTMTKLAKHVCSLFEQGKTDIEVLADMTKGKGMTKPQGMDFGESAVAVFCPEYNDQITRYKHHL